MGSQTPHNAGEDIHVCPEYAPAPAVALRGPARLAEAPCQHLPGHRPERQVNTQLVNLQRCHGPQVANFQRYLSTIKANVLQALATTAAVPTDVRQALETKTAISNCSRYHQANVHNAVAKLGLQRGATPDEGGAPRPEDGAPWRVPREDTLNCSRRGHPFAKHKSALDLSGQQHVQNKCTLLAGDRA